MAALRAGGWRPAWDRRRWRLELELELELEGESALPGLAPAAEWRRLALDGCFPLLADKS